MNNNLSRIPQDFSFDNNALYKQFDNETPIIMDIIAYCVREKLYNTSLWNEVTISIEGFAKEFGYSRAELSRLRFPNEDKLPPKKRHNIMLGEHKIENVFEYALYRALKENIVVTRHIKNDRDEVEEVSRSYRIIEQLKCNINDSETKKKLKHIYTISLASELLDAIIGKHKNYFLFDYNDYKNITSGKSVQTQGRVQ